jgi:tRNA threonylcarbamoyladenosine biosynthesis protein TsaE
VDLYRVETARDLETLGLEDLLAESAVVIIEWGEKLGPALRPLGTGRVIEIHLKAAGENARRIDAKYSDE